MTKLTESEPLMEAACCIWEEFLRLNTLPASLVEAKWITDLRLKWINEGTASMRLNACHLAELCDKVWNQLAPEEQDHIGSFDWDFVPAFVAEVFSANIDDAYTLYLILRNQLCPDMER